MHDEIELWFAIPLITVLWTWIIAEPIIRRTVSKRSKKRNRRNTLDR